MSTTPHPVPSGESETLEERIAEIRAARELVFRLASDGDRAWRMSIPVRDDDSDVLLMRVLDRAAQTAAEVARLTAKLAEARDDLRRECEASEHHRAEAARYREALADLVCSAWHEGYKDGLGDGHPLSGRPHTWEESAARADLAALTTEGGDPNA